VSVKLAVNVCIFGLDLIEFVLILFVSVSRLCLEMTARGENLTESMRDWKTIHCFSMDSSVLSLVDAGVGVEEAMFISTSVAASVRDVEISIMVFGG